MQCPKDKQVELIDDRLPEGPSAKCCPQCQGAWIPADAYQAWQAARGVTPVSEDTVEVVVLPSTAELTFQPPEHDGRAALCPECQNYLARGRINLSDGMFFVERCPNCQGYWCDSGEWPVLQQLQLHIHLEAIFSDLWQAQVKDLEAAHREREATIEKLGPEIADKVFHLADVLEQHPNGDFGVAYLMRRFEK